MASKYDLSTTFAIARAAAVIAGGFEQFVGFGQVAAERGANGCAKAAEVAFFAVGAF